ncbi:MAG: hypothetical protein NZ805_03655 [Armatimonadetes bacterium]|nr:hypothetical protein [Armatimonadota bacterium]MDW8029103.1 hypothetical protein [Armatimonadota bacterium]
MLKLQWKHSTKSEVNVALENFLKIFAQKFVSLVLDAKLQGFIPCRQAMRLKGRRNSKTILKRHIDKAKARLMRIIKQLF